MIEVTETLGRVWDPKGEGVLGVCSQEEWERVEMAPSVVTRWVIWVDTTETAPESHIINLVC